MRISLIVLGLGLSLPTSVFAQYCPRLEGSFECRSNPPFALQIHDQFQNGLTFYTFSDPSMTQTIVPDGQPREMATSSGKGSYVARCEGSRLVMDVQGANGGRSRDTYYIERAALVRVRIIPGVKAESLSCKPVGGTWNLYRH